jgi:hypothetical protein
MAHANILDDDTIVFSPLVYPEIKSPDSIKNILFIHHDLGSSSAFYNDCNASTFPILFEAGSSRADVKALLQQHWTSIDRIGFVFHDPSVSGNLRFLEYESLFSSADLVEGVSSFSPSVSFLLDLIKTFSVKHVDFLACYTLLYPRWKSYYNLLASQTGATIGASDDETGNQKYGGDWILENTKEDVIDLYFTGALLSDFTGTLAETIGGPGMVVDFNPSTANWPVTIAGGTTVIITSDATLTGTNNYFILGGDDISIDGSGHVFTVTVNEYPGLVRNGTVTAGSGKSNITLSNLRVESTTYYLSGAAGWIGQAYFGTDASGILFSYCSSNGPIGAYVDGVVDRRRNGGICGGSNQASGTLSPNSGQITAQYCYSTGTIIGQEAGGIFGRRAGSFGGSATAIHCYSTGDQPLTYAGASVRNLNSGGIFGSRAGNDGTATALNCYSTGDMLGSSCGGIFGQQAAETDAYPTYGVGTVVATNCYSTGAIGSVAGGGLCGGILGGLASVSNSTAFGAGSVGGGIFTVSKCYSTGAIGPYSGGIVASQCCYNSIQTCTVSDCYSTGAISGAYSGGIIGSYAGYNDINAGGSPTLNITNCYSQGSIIIDSTAGGIISGSNLVPAFSNPIIVNITNSYMLGSGTYVGTGYGAYMTLTTTNDYNVNGGVWSDATAVGALTGTPSTFPGGGITWSSTLAETPFLLSSFTSTYTQPVQVVLAGGQTSPGPYTGGVYSLFSVNGSTSPSVLSLFSINAATGVITVPLTTPNNAYSIVVLYEGSYFFISLEVDVACLCRGMKIDTPNGPVPIESLQEGDLVLVPPNDRAVPIERIFSSTYVGTRETVPFRIPRHFFEQNVPSEDILLSPHHAVFYNGKWRLPIYINGLYRDESYMGKEFEYYHLQLPDYGQDKLWCQNMPVDSWDGSAFPLESPQEETCTVAASEKNSMLLECPRSTV